MYYSKCILCFISIIFFLVSCKETCDTTPFNFHCLIRVVGGDDSSSFKKKPDQIYEIVTNLLEPRNAKIVNFVYLENYVIKECPPIASKSKFISSFVCSHLPQTLYKKETLLLLFFLRH